MVYGRLTAYLSGGGGVQMSGSGCAGSGGSGSYGVYIQANAITNGIINANGTNGANGNCGG